jgi:hypothetical protein
MCGGRSLDRALKVAAEIAARVARDYPLISEGRAADIAVAVVLHIQAGERSLARDVLSSVDAWLIGTDIEWSSANHVRNTVSVKSLMSDAEVQQYTPRTAVSQSAAPSAHQKHRAPRPKHRVTQPRAPETQPAPRTAAAAQPAPPKRVGNVPNGRGSKPARNTENKVRT